MSSMCRMTTSFIAILMLFVSRPIMAHPGRLDASGCHHNRRSGGYHCHSGNSSRRIAKAKTSQQGQGQTSDDTEDAFNHDEIVRMQTAISDSRPGEGEYRSAKNAMIKAGCWSEMFDSILVAETIGRYVKRVGLSALYGSSDASQSPTEVSLPKTYAPDALADGFNCCTQRAGIAARVPDRPAPLFCSYPQEEILQCIMSNLKTKKAVVFSKDYEIGKELDSARFIDCGNIKLFCGLSCKRSLGLAICAVGNNVEELQDKYRTVSSCSRPPPERTPGGWAAFPSDD